MEEQIIGIIERLTNVDGIKDTTDLIEEDILDSLAFIELVFELEKTFNIEIQPTQVSSETWRDVKKIAQMVKSLKE